MWVGRMAETHSSWGTRPSQDLHLFSHHPQLRQKKDVVGVQLMLIQAGHLKKPQATSKNIYFWACITC